MILITAVTLSIILWLNCDANNAQLCPNDHSFDPCVCDNITNSVQCVGTEYVDVQKVFRSAAKSVTAQPKHFDRFTLTNPAINEIGFHLFNEIRFTKVHFVDCFNLTFFSVDAFGGETPFIEELVLRNTPVHNAQPHHFDLFDAINRLPSLKLLDLSGTQLSAIPSDAFIPILTWMDHQLKQLYFCSDGQQCRSITRVGNKAFYYLYSIELIDISRHLISYIDHYAFSLHNFTETSTLNIVLDDNMLSSDSFAENAFRYVGKPTHLSLVNNKNLTHLSENVFKTFLDDHKSNKINASLCAIDSTADSMKWLTNAYKSRVYF